jgi:hypothetical protein
MKNLSYAVNGAGSGVGHLADMTVVSRYVRAVVFGSRDDTGG